MSARPMREPFHHLACTGHARLDVVAASAARLQPLSHGVAAHLAEDKVDVDRAAAIAD